MQRIRYLLRLFVVFVLVVVVVIIVVVAAAVVVVVVVVVAVVVVVVVVVLTLTHRYNAVRRHRTGSNYSGAEDYLRRKTVQKEDNIYTRAETNRISQKKKRKGEISYRTYVSRYISYAKRVEAGTETEETA